MHVSQDAPPASAVFALAAWAKGATRDDVERVFFASNRWGSPHGEGGGTTGPLHDVVTRVLLYTPPRGGARACGRAEDPSRLDAGCAALIAALLAKPSGRTGGEGDAVHSSALQKTIEQLLRWGRALAIQLKSEGGSNRNGSATTPARAAANVADCVVDLLRRAAEEGRAYALEAEVTALERAGQQRSGGAGGGAQDLLARRDATRRLADAAGQALEISLGEARGREEDGARTNGHVNIKQSTGEAEEGIHNGHVKGAWGIMHNGAKKDVNCMEIWEEEKKSEDSHGQTVEGAAQNGGAVEDISPEIGQDLCSQSPPPPLARWQELAQRILSAPLFRSVAISVEQVQSLEKKTADFREERSEVRNALSRRRRDLAAGRVEIGRIMLDQPQNLEEFEARERQLTKEEGQIATESKMFEASLGDRLKGLAEELQGLEGGVHARDEAVYGAVRGTAEKLTELEEAWLRSPSSSPVASSSPSPSPIKAPAGVSPQRALDRYLQHALSYARAEARLRRFLRRRAAVATSQAAELEQEARCYRDMGMTRSVELLTDDLQTLREHAAEDGAALAASRKDEETLRSDLIQRVREYKKAGDVKHFPVELFDQISKELQDVETSEGQADSEGSNGIAATPDSEGSNGTAAAPDSEGSNGAAAAPDSEESNGAAATPESARGKTATTPPLNGPATANGVVSRPAPAMPKLCWANGGAPKKQKAANLRDIQRKELEDKFVREMGTVVIMMAEALDGEN